MSVERTWSAKLELAYHFDEKANKTVLHHRRHQGPLRVQKSLYPEGEAVCHNFIVHPPAGIAGGDHLDIQVNLAEDSHVVLSTPGAGKWYKSAGLAASQHFTMCVSDKAKLEWLPQENIVFNGAEATQAFQLDLAENACYIGWDITCLGRQAQDEKLAQGRLQQRTQITRNGRPLWIEQARIDGNDPLLSAQAGLANCPVYGTLLAVWDKHSVLSHTEKSKTLMTQLQAIKPKHMLGDSHYGITRLPELIIARFVGHSSEAARDYFIALWHILRPIVMDLPAQDLRIWKT